MILYLPDKFASYLVKLYSINMLRHYDEKYRLVVKLKPSPHYFFVDEKVLETVSLCSQEIIIDRFLT
jgi:hypothetical protein